MSQDLLLKRLRLRRLDGTPATQDLAAAADRIEALEARVAAARKILETMYDCDPEIREWLAVADREAEHE